MIIQTQRICFYCTGAIAIINSHSRKCHICEKELDLCEVCFLISKSIALYFYCSNRCEKTHKDIPKIV